MLANITLLGYMMTDGKHRHFISVVVVDEKVTSFVVQNSLSGRKVL